MTCFDCRKQCEAAGQPAPCDIDVCKYDPSPGDIGPKGCGLAPENELAVWLYPRWKQFGDLAINLAHVELSPYDGDMLLDKLMLIEDYVPIMQKKRSEKERARGQMKRHKKQRRK